MTRIVLLSLSLLLLPSVVFADDPCASVCEPPGCTGSGDVRCQNGGTRLPDHCCASYAAGQRCANCRAKNTPTKQSASLAVNEMKGGSDHVPAPTTGRKEDPCRDECQQAKECRESPYGWETGVCASAFERCNKCQRDRGRKSTDDGDDLSIAVAVDVYPSCGPGQCQDVEGKCHPACKVGEKADALCQCHEPCKPYSWWDPKRARCIPNGNGMPRDPRAIGDVLQFPVVVDSVSFSVDVYPSCAPGQCQDNAGRCHPACKNGEAADNACQCHVPCKRGEWWDPKRAKCITEQPGPEGPRSNVDEVVAVDCTTLRAKCLSAKGAEKEKACAALRNQCPCKHGCYCDDPAWDGREPCDGNPRMASFTAANCDVRRRACTALESLCAQGDSRACRNKTQCWTDVKRDCGK